MATNHEDQHNFRAGINTKTSDADVTATPTDAEFDSAFGTPAAVGDGFIGTLDDAGSGATGYLVWSDGANWFYLAGTKAL